MRSPSNARSNFAFERSFELSINSGGFRDSLNRAVKLDSYWTLLHQSFCCSAEKVSQLLSGNGRILEGPLLRTILFSRLLGSFAWEFKEFGGSKLSR